MINNKQYLLSFVLVVFSFNAKGTLASTVFTQPLPDTEKFACKYCPEEESKTKALELGLGLNTEKNEKFSEYNGQESLHLMPLIDGTFSVVTDDNKHYSFNTRNLGLASREINANFGEYGNYDINLGYDQITRLQADGLSTEFAGDNTSELTGLSSVMSGSDFRQERYRFSVSLNKVLNPKWEGVVDYHVENKKGLQALNAAMYTSYIDARSVLLPMPIDQITQQFKVGLAFKSQRLQFEGGFKTSLYVNSLAYLRWENPFSYDPGTATAMRSDYGRIALSPDSQHHQLYGLGALRIKSWGKLKGQLTIGRMIQDQSFLQYTSNDGLTNPTLPTSSLGGKVNTITGNIRGTINPNEKFTINANLSGDRKDNRTHQAAYNYVVLDTVASGSNTRTNLPYSYTKYGADVSASYRYRTRDNFTAGYKYQQISRTHSDVSNTKSNELWLLNKNQIARSSNIRLKLSQETRTADDYLNQQSLQSSLMRKYYLAERTRNKVSANLDYSGFRQILIDGYVSYAMDDYTDSKVGLESANEVAYGVNVSTFINEISLNAYLGQERLSSSQNGVSGSLNWKIDNSDTFTSLGVSAEWNKLTDELDLGLSYHISMANSVFETSTGSSTDKLPDMESKRHTFEAFARYEYNEDIFIKGSYLFENYDESDWHVDDLNYDSVTDVRGVPFKTYSYNVHYLVASIVYKF